MQTHELDAWLGDARHDLTPGHYATIARIASQLEARYGDADDNGEATEALSGALAALLGDMTLSEAGDDLLAARIAEREAMARLTGALLVAREHGLPETTMAEHARVTRVTVRRALGKDR